MTRLLDKPLPVFAGILGLSALGSISLGGNVLVSAGLWLVLTLTFWTGLYCGRNPEPDSVAANKPDDDEWDPTVEGI